MAEELRQCRYCPEKKPLSEFKPSWSCRGGKSHQCVECYRRRARARYRQGRIPQIIDKLVLQKSLLESELKRLNDELIELQTGE